MRQLAPVALLLLATPAFGIFAKYQMAAPPYEANYMDGVNRPVILPDNAYSAFSETAIAESENGQTILIAYNDIEAASLENYCAVNTGLNGGLLSFPYKKTVRSIGLESGTFVDMSAPTNWQASDPSLTRDKAGRFYFGSVLFPFDFAGNCSTAENYFVVSSSTDGLNWSALTSVGGWNGIFHDRPWLVADDQQAGVIWATFNGFVTDSCDAGENGELGQVHIARSTDQGVTWQVGTTNRFTQQPDLNFVVVNGAAIVPILVPDCCGGGHISVQRCTSNLTCTEIASFVSGLIVTQDHTQLPTLGTQRLNSMPVIAADASGQNLIIAYMGLHPVFNETWINTVISHDGGYTWDYGTGPQASSDIQLFPMVAWDGAVPAICWYERSDWGVAKFAVYCARGQATGDTYWWPGPHPVPHPYDNRMAKLLDVTTVSGLPFIGDYIGYNGRHLASVNVTVNPFAPGNLSRQAFIEMDTFHADGCAIVPATNRGALILLIVPVLALLRRRRSALIALFAVTLVASAARANPLIGDCNGDGCVRVNELVTGVEMMLGEVDVSACEALVRGARL